MIEADGENPAILTAWDSLTTNWDFFEEFVHSVPNFTLYIHSRKRVYEVERDGVTVRQLLSRSNAHEYSLIFANTAEVKKRPLHLPIGEPDLTTEQGRRHFIRRFMDDVGGSERSVSNCRGRDCLGRVTEVPRAPGLQLTVDMRP